MTHPHSEALAQAPAVQAPAGEESLQARYQVWMDKVCEGDPTDLKERCARAAEEFFELMQALHVPASDLQEVMQYTYGRPEGTPFAELGGAISTLAALAEFIDLDMMACGEAELARVDTPAMIAKVRGKRSRRHGRGALPGLEADLIPTPTDAQPKPARPVGDEALRAAKAHQEMQSWLATRLDKASRDSDAHPAGSLNRSFYNGQAVAYENALDALGEPASHPTTGQETVATPRDGGVREALGQGTIADEPYDPLKCAIWAALLPFQDELRHSGGVTFMGLRNAVVEAVRSFAIASQVEALSAPGSAGPGEWPASYQRTFDAICKAVTVHPHVGLNVSVRSFYRALGYSPTPSPAQEPGTGDTGERAGSDRFIACMNEEYISWRDSPNGKKYGPRPPRAAFQAGFARGYECATPATTAETAKGDRA